MMFFRHTYLMLSCCGLVGALISSDSSSALAQSPSSIDSVDFQRDVRPILAENCFQCHGPDVASRRAGLRLDTQEGALRARLRGAAVVAADADASLLYQRVTHTDARRRMPPIGANKTLTDRQIEVLRQWIEDGASWDQHWSFASIEAPGAPRVASEGWIRQPLDRFVLSRLEAEGVVARTRGRPPDARASCRAGPHGSPS